MLEHLKNTDCGTPASLSEELVTLHIDGREVTVPKGTSLMRAAVDGGIKVPKLCATDSLEPFGSCRLCLVQIEGRKGFPASCTTPAEAGMKVRTQSPQLQELRKGVMELYISDHPLDCLTCSSNGDCELQDMAGVVGLREVRYGFKGEIRAIGDVLPDQLFLMARCGIDAFALRADKDADKALALFDTFKTPYQAAVDQPQPLFRRRAA